MKRTTFNQSIILALTLTLGLSLIGLLRNAGAQGMQPQDALDSAFTYQGKLLKDGSATTDTCDFQFSLWDAASDSDQVGSTQTIGGVSVADGHFAVSLNSGDEFGSNAFTGDARYLQIAAKCTGDGDFVTLSGRVALTAAPYALYATSAPWDGLKDVPAGFADGVDDAGADYQNVIVVAKSGGDLTSVQAALDSIGDNSAANRYLVWVAPGTYAETVTMKPYVDIQGAGELATKITAAGSAAANTGTVIGADNAELRFLTVENTGGNTYAIAIYNHSASPRLTHLTAIALGAVAEDGWNYGMYNDTSSPMMTDVTVTADASEGFESTARGVYNRDNSSPTMTDVTVTAIGWGEGCGVYNDTSSPTMTGVTITANGIFAYGVYNNSSSPTMTNVIITGSGTEASGVHNVASAPTMADMVITVTGFMGYGYGVYNDSSSPEMTNVTIIADTDIDEGYGIYNQAGGGSHRVEVNNAQIRSGLNTIVNDTEFTTRVGASQLAGGTITGGGTVTCAGVYDENYAFYPNTCP